MKKILTTICLMFSMALPSFAIAENTEIQKDANLSLSDCISLAVKNSPKIKKAEYSLKQARAGVSLARSDYFPTIGAETSFSYKLNSDIEYDSGTNVKNFPTVGVYLDQLIFNFGKTSSKIKMRKFNELAAEYLYLESICETINDVKLKYFNVIQAREIVNVEKMNVEINEKILKTTQDLYQQKKKTEIDFINAQVYLSDAQMHLESAKNTYEQALADLSNAMYVAGAPNFNVIKIDVFDSYDAFFSPSFLETPSGQWHAITGRPREKILGNVQELPFTMEEAWETAYKNSPDLKVMKSTLEAMKQSLIMTKRQYYPTLSARVGYAYDDKFRRRDGYDQHFWNNQFAVGARLATSINGMKHVNEVKQAEAIVNKAQSDIDDMEQFIYYNVKKCYLNVKTAEKQISNSKIKVNNALTNLEMTGNDYYAGKANYIELQNARQNYNQAMIDYISKINAYNVSLAKLEKATHNHIDDVYSFAEQKIKIDKSKNKPKSKNGDDTQSEEIKPIVKDNI